MEQLTGDDVDQLIEWCREIGLKVQELQRRVRRLEAENDLDFEMPDVSEG